MWGKHIESELHEAQSKAKNETQARQKIGMVIQRLLTDPEDERPRSDSESSSSVQPGRFADPAARMKR